jgi:hypothetical protein
MQTRRRFKQTNSLLERLSRFIANLRREAGGVPERPEREKLLKKIRQAETASEIEGGRTRPNCSPLSDRTGRGFGVVRAAMIT